MTGTGLRSGNHTSFFFDSDLKTSPPLLPTDTKEADLLRIHLVLALFILDACSEPTAPPSVRLVDLFDAATVEGAGAEQPEIPRTEWRFDESIPAAGPNQGWQAGPGVTGLGVREGRLTGGTTSATPIIHLTRTTSLQDFDLLHAVEIRMRASAGANLAVIFRHGDELNIQEARRTLPLFPLGRMPSGTREG